MIGGNRMRIMMMMGSIVGREEETRRSRGYSIRGNGLPEIRKCSQTID